MATLESTYTAASFMSDRHTLVNGYALISGTPSGKGGPDMPTQASQPIVTPLCQQITNGSYLDLTLALLTASQQVLQQQLIFSYPLNRFDEV